MPFGGRSDDYYAHIYVPAIEEARLRPERADEVFRAGSVLQDIVASLSRAAVVLVDISDDNRNVHYELGIAHALGRPTLLIAPQGMPLFFDVGQERMITYDKNNAFWGPELQRALVKALVGTVAAPETAIPTAFMHIKPSRVVTDEVTVRLRRIEEQLADLSRSILPRREIQSGFAEKIHSPLAAQAEATKLLTRLSPDEAVRQLVLEGYRPAMAEDAVFVAAKQVGISPFPKKDA
jgi:hypothetical protein